MSYLQIATLVLRLTLAFTFAWTSYKILKDLPSWASIIEESWIGSWWPVPHKQTMQAVAVFDLGIGLWLVSGIYLPVAAGLASLHLVQVLLTTGVSSPAYRDVGLLGSSLALLALSL